MLSGADSVTSDGFRSVKFIYGQGGFQALFFAFGIGPSVLCSMYIQMGADFIVSPAMVEEVVPLCNRRGCRAHSGEPFRMGQVRRYRCRHGLKALPQRGHQSR